MRHQAYVDMIMEDYNKNFIDIELSEDTVYVYSVRRGLQKAIDKMIPSFSGVLVDLGCGEMPYRKYILDKNKNISKYIGVDIDHSRYHREVKPDLFWDGSKIGLKDGSADTVVATELFEHVADLDGILAEIHRVLKKNGSVFFTVPFIWPLHETPNDEYRYTPYSLKRALEKEGFTAIDIIPLGGYNAALAQMICIWTVNRRNESSTRLKKAVFAAIEKYVLYPSIKKLLKRDDRSNVTAYGENTMPTGFYGYAKK
jgi:predicted TPR repeat methyltransferase